ncbi:hypothetical protein L1987_19720 [Smallanthus sonchifolius]|uniref:Uncharacterized protein n=1 Tax=Smallanthus sonchifolius TaxID=185202 RepID=A0ACB9IQL5_9ASTR|nr:hypothetical protein L1987_19720 [Smallanthus sonchifolius]
MVLLILTFLFYYFELFSCYAYNEDRKPIVDGRLIYVSAVSDDSRRFMLLIFAVSMLDVALIIDLSNMPY